MAKGQSRAILRAYELAGYKPNTVELIETHGTATRAGDVAEFHGLQIAFSDADDARKSYCALGSIKSQIGHTKGAAGTAGLFKAIMALHHKVLPPTIKVTQPNPELDWESSPFYLNTETRPWVRSKKYPRRAGVSSFGFGGSNFHVTLEEYSGPNKAEYLATVSTELVILAAEKPTALINLCKEYIKLAELESLSYLARTSQENYNPDDLARIAVVSCDNKDLQQKLQEAVKLLEENSKRPLLLAKGIYYGFACDPGRVAFLFPGQGSQYVNMGADIAMSFTETMTKWDQAANLEFNNDELLQNVVFPKPVFDQSKRQEQEELLRMTGWAQPAIAVTSLMYLSVLDSLQIRPDCLAGHSFGELVALCAAGAIDENTLLLIAKKRGELMQEGSKDIASGMISVTHPTQEVLSLIKNEKLSVVPANYNSPNQLVLSGSLAELEKVQSCLQQKNIQCQRLSVSAAFHSPYMKTASTSFKSILDKIAFNAPSIPIFSNETAQPYSNDQTKIPAMLAEQLIKPVRFQEIIENMYQMGVRTFVELGPRNILSGLVNATLSNEQINSVALDIKGDNGITNLWNGFGKLFVIGLNPNFKQLWQSHTKETKNVATKSHTLRINGAHYGKPYPPLGGSKDLPKPNPEKNNLTQTTIIPEKKYRGDEMSETSNSLLQTYQEMNRQLIEAHNTYQKTMADTHIAFLNAISQMNQQMASPNQVLAQSHFQPTTATATTAPIQKTAPIALQQSAPKIYSTPAPTMSIRFNVAPIVQPQNLSRNISDPKLSDNTIPVNKIVTQRTTNHIPQATDLKDLILGIVVEKTGYPLEQLNLDMSIESDLGIDSIKRVEILSSLSEKIPNLPALDVAQLSEIQTLRDVINYASGHQQPQSVAQSA